MATGIFKYEPLWGEWYVDEPIGKGSYGEVYKIHKDVEGVRVEAAAKYISIPKAEDKKNFRHYTEDELVTLFNERADKFSVEISSMLKLRDCRNVVRYEDHIKKQKDNDIGWDIVIRMELLTSLEDYLDANEFSRKDIVKLGIDICSAIKSCQNIDIIHRDIKIENIFVDGDGNYKLGDFGVSKVGSGTATGTVTGTEDYMAPEITQEHKYNKTVDIYALGIAMYQLLNKRRKPFIDADSVPGQDAEAQAHLRRIKGEQMPPPKYANEELARIVLKACAYDRHERYATPDEMANDLKAVLDTLEDMVVITPRQRGSFYQSENPSGTYSDISSGAKREGTYSDISFDKDNNGTVRDTDIQIQPKKKKNKGLLIALIAAICIAAAVLIFIFIPKGSDNAGTESIKIESIEGLPEDVTNMVIGDTLDLNPQVMPANATGKITFESENSDIATVDENGIVTAVSDGKVNIKIQGDDVVSYVSINITKAKVPVADILGVPTTNTLTVGGGLQINAHVTPDDATEQEITYSSSNNSIATVTADGYVSAIAAGTVTITAYADGVEKQMVLTVKSATGSGTGRGSSGGGGSSSGGSSSGGSSSGGSSSGGSSGGSTIQGGGEKEHKDNKDKYRIDSGSGSGIQGSV
ncbi:MAG: protein kinase [Clostridia bacterium]|nr:protein kinase [Clostridia bacterium]